jgi:hypothetical protein
MNNIVKFIFCCTVIVNSNQVVNQDTCNIISPTEPDISTMLIKRQGNVLVEDFIEDNQHLFDSEQLEGGDYE